LRVCGDVDNRASQNSLPSVWFSLSRPRARPERASPSNCTQMFMRYSVISAQESMQMPMRVPATSRQSRLQSVLPSTAASGYWPGSPSSAILPPEHLLSTPMRCGSGERGDALSIDICERLSGRPGTTVLDPPQPEPDPVKSCSEQSIIFIDRSTTQCRLGVYGDHGLRGPAIRLRIRVHHPVLCVNQCQIAHIVFRDERPRVFYSISSQYRQASRKT
jgi:hypothetical protein